MKYQSTACLSTGSAHQSIPSAWCLWSKANVVLPSPRRASGLSSMMLQPALDSSPFSSCLRLLSPIEPSRVRVVPLRFMASSLPGYHIMSRPFSFILIFSTSGFLSAALITPPTLYRSVSAPVLISSIPPLVTCVKAGTGSLRFTTPKVARSSKRPSWLYCIRIISGVSTVKRALPAVITACALATGS